MTFNDFCLSSLTVMSIEKNNLYRVYWLKDKSCIQFAFQMYNCIHLF